MSHLKNIYSLQNGAESNEEKTSDIERLTKTVLQPPILLSIMFTSSWCIYNNITLI